MTELTGRPAFVRGPRSLGRKPTDAAPGTQGLPKEPWQTPYTDENGYAQGVDIGAAGTVPVSQGTSTPYVWGSPPSMLKTVTPGYFTIPTGPSLGTSVTAGSSANAFGSYSQLLASTSAALYIVGVRVSITTAATTITYTQVGIGTGAGGAETSISTLLVAGRYGDSGMSNDPVTLPCLIPVPTSTRIAVRLADAPGASNAYVVSLLCVNQSDVAGI